MFESVTTKRTLLAVAGVSGMLAVAGCGNTVEGIGNIPMVHCKDGQQPRSNAVNIQKLPKGEKIQLGKAITTDEHGDSATGDFYVSSQGGGEFTVTINKDNNSNDISVIPNNNDKPNEVTVTDAGEIFTIAGQPGPQGTTSLEITDTCQPAE